MVNAEPSRREFCATLLGSLLTYSLLTACSKPQVVSTAVVPVVRHWAIELNEYCSDLKLGRIPQSAWQESVERLFSRVDLDDLLGFIDFETLEKGLKYPDLGVATENVRLPPLDGLPRDVAFIKKIFGMRKGRAIIPHGHSNMASAHLVLGGQFKLRHYEKLSLDKGHMTIRPTIDKTAATGSASSISDEANNVHWFVAESDRAFTFDVIMLDIAGKRYDIHNLDLDRAERIGGDTLRVPVIDVDTALKRYGKAAMH
ncbi:MAG: hypothetical protein IPM25_06560 [Chloracidobacterium sp.]|nr:hypothetical protein [Chloracidobacterium sp.]